LFILEVQQSGKMVDVYGKSQEDFGIIMALKGLAV